MTLALKGRNINCFHVLIRPYRAKKCGFISPRAYEKEYTRDSNQFVVPPSGGSFKVPGHINN